MQRLIKIAFFLFLITVPPLLSVAFAQEDTEVTSKAASKRPVYVLPMAGAISPANAEYLTKGLAAAQAQNAQALVIELNTPGGLLSTTREMVTTIVESPMPVIVWVTPSGAHAASAGTFILYASHIAAMDKGTNVGAATPIEMKGEVHNQVEDPDTVKKAKTVKDEEEESELRQLLQDLVDPNTKAMRAKAIEDTAAFIRGLAELRGRNADWAEKAVTEADSITAEEALEKGVIELIVTSRDELLAQIDGKTITLDDKSAITLETKDAPVFVFEPDWRTKFLALITDPNIAFILMSIGIYGLILEFYNPGTMIPGTIGSICLVLALYAMNVLPINITGVILMVLGIAFMIAEAFVPSFGILGFGGLAAFVFGAAMMFDTSAMPGMELDWSVIIAIAAFGAFIMALIVFLAVKTMRRQVSVGPESMIGRHAEIVEWDGKKGRVRIQGEIWQAYSDAAMEITGGEEVVVRQIDDLKLKVSAD